MAIDKIKKILFTLICIVLVASAGVIAYAAWDDVTGKKTNDLTTTTGTNTTLAAPSVNHYNTDAKYRLVPYGTVNFTDEATKANPTNYMSWKITPTLSDTTKIDPNTKTVIEILYKSLTVVVKKGETVLASNNGTGVAADTIFTYGLSATQPTGDPITLGTVKQPGTTKANVLISGTAYYFTIRFKDNISANNVTYAGCTIDIIIDLEAKGLPTA